MSEDKKTVKPKKIVDIAHPGETAPSPNSKSVIISHRPAVQDPMMTDQSGADKTSEQSLSTPSTKSPRTVLHPLPSSELLQPMELQTPSSESAATSPPKDAEPAVPQQTFPAPRETQYVAQPPVASTGSDAVIGTKDVQSDAAVANDSDAEEQRLTELQAMIDDKRYYLSVNTLEKKRTKQFVLGGILVSVVLIAAWVDIALDSGLLHIEGVKALTHFFAG